MLIELVTHTAVPGRLDEFQEAAFEQLHPALQRAGARLLFWTTGASGRLNECIAAWCHGGAVAHAQAQDALAADAQWHAARRRLAGTLLREHVQLVRTTGFSGGVALPPAATRLIDLRTYSFEPEGLQGFLPICESDGLPRQREHCGQLVFHGTSASGRLHQLVQAWAYPDHASYDAGQKNLFRDAAWARGYRTRVIHLVQEQEHRLLRPLARSPEAP